MNPTTLVIVRHGQSEWNMENRFTGWQDIDLTEHGREEALEAARKLKDEHFDIAYTSMLRRAQHTLTIIMDACSFKLPVVKDKALDERCYGDLEGLNKADTAIKYGEEQVLIWRRSYDIAPPGGECLRDTADRVIPYFESKIAPKLKDGKNVLIVAHGNSLRSLMMHLEKLSPEQIIQTELPTGVPRKYVFDERLTLKKAVFL